MEIVRDLGATGSTTILRLKGPLTISTLFLLQDTLREIPDGDTVIDVSEVPYIDSAGLGNNSEPLGPHAADRPQVRGDWRQPAH